MRRDKKKRERREGKRDLADTNPNRSTDESLSI
jgi:hypothetical protein